MKRGFGAAILIVTLCVPGAARADETSVSPYIDQLKKEMREKEGPESHEVPDPYIQSIKQGLKNGDSQSYTEHLKQTLPPKGAEESYTDRLKREVPPKAEGGAIEAVREGRSTLQAKRDERISGAGGLRYGASLARDITAAPGVSYQPFNSIYGANYAPDLALFYEYQPWHSEWYGNIGLITSFGVGYFHGFGTFAIPNLPNAAAPPNTVFPPISQTAFQFFTIPITAGIDYRFNLFRIVRPFVELSPAAIGYVEMRNDPQSGHRGFSKGAYGAVGASLLLDWLNPSASWDTYAGNGVKHTYLTVEYRRLQTISSDVSINVSGVDAGVTFEF